ncbi:MULTISPECIES: phosphoribosylanthranilate isomerase [Bacillus]|uniref:N-(5'-phosphoribosyl)anthranilate isomerase n=2 Tax=Bacillus TaxID=1386 RepID=A0A0M4FG32_9BACI|nr:MULTISPECIES: phosphoribosylanthranilate isomerase [Bacillus]ALC81411.1 N-(5'-phosphoribosyl)anthranilate isomerase [Bacillus gobiensis]MBP1080443.1 phosphoribosylanthranilate isomerase [Bacillus capparidis]MED1094300.1 phosphoribosylanthranilate isomerase [Bacillus capparidis]
MGTPKLKYCGMTSLRDFQVASQSKADYIGFIFAESKRKVLPQDVKGWIDHTDPAGKKLVGIFVNESVPSIVQTAAESSLDVIQLHGDETVSEITELKKQLSPEKKIWKALHHNDKTLQLMETYSPAVDGFVIDTFSKKQRGGTGESFPWEYIPSYTKAAIEAGKDCFIAGGISAENVEDLMKWKPSGVDLSSGIEENGRKSSALIKMLEERMFHHE